MIDDFESIKPEDIFSMVTLRPENKTKLDAWLEDNEGTVFSLSNLCEDIIEHVHSHLARKESTALNSKIFPLLNNFTVGILGRMLPIPITGLLLGAPTYRYSIITLVLSVTVLMQYIKKNNLKIVTSETQISQEELDNFLSMSKNAQEQLAQLFGEYSERNSEDVN